MAGDYAIPTKWQGEGIDLAHRPQSGVYATAQIIEQPKILDKQQNIEDWLEKSRLGIKPQAIIRFTKKLLDAPLLRENLKQDPILKSLSVIGQPNATNYKVTHQDWQRVEEWKN